MEHNTGLSFLPADLVLEGGGVKGIGLVGALTVLESKGYKFQRVAGTSAGAIVGALVAAGCSAERITELMQTLNYRKFRDDTTLSKFGPVGKLISLLVNNGLYKGDYLEDWIEARLAECGVRTFADLKLADVHEGIPRHQAYKLVVVTADLSKGKVAYLPWDYHKYGLDPDTQSVARAVRASMSIPFFYQTARVGRSTCVDGGVLSNFPIAAFDSTSQWPTFGIKLSAKERAIKPTHVVRGPLSLAASLFSTMMSAHDRRHLDKPSTQARTIFVDTKDTQATDFDISRTEQDMLYLSGVHAATKFLGRWDFTAFKKKYPHH